MSDLSLPLKSRDNNFDFLRILFALFVIISHAFTLTGVPDVEEWLFKYGNGIATFSYLGVGGFFVISGYLVYQSFQRSATYKEFMLKRGLRVFPGLIVNLFIVAFIIGPFLTTVSHYYLKPDPYLYFIRNLLLATPEYHIQDIFNKNPYSSFINGSLWTLGYEVLFYILFIILFIGRRYHRVALHLIPLLILVMIYLGFRYGKTERVLPFTFIAFRHICHLGIWFLMGMWLCVLKDKQLLNKVLFVIGLAGFALTIGRVVPAWVLYLCWPLVVIGFGTMATPFISKVHRWGDPSYGIYIYGFFIQQVLIHMGITNLCLHMLLAMIIATLVGYASWHLVEKRMLRFKRK